MTVCLYSCLSQPACQSDVALYLYLWPVGQLSYFSISSHKWHDFSTDVIDYKMVVLIASTSSVRDISHSKKNSVIYYHKCTLVIM
jgi:hypothetical protein